MASPKTSTTYDMSMKAERMGFFETPIVAARLNNPEALIRDLKEVIKERMKSTPGVERSNIGGWHSDTAMLDWGGTPARKLSDQTIAVIRRLTHFHGRSVEKVDWRVQMWANVSGPGALNHMHTHPGNLWAAVFYVDLGRGKGDPAASGGELYFEDPRFPMAAMHTTAFRFIGEDGKPQPWQPEMRPEAGDLVVFPAWLSHGVRPYTGTDERVSIAMNLDPVLR